MSQPSVDAGADDARDASTDAVTRDFAIDATSIDAERMDMVMASDASTPDDAEPIDANPMDAHVTIDADIFDAGDVIDAGELDAGELDAGEPFDAGEAPDAVVDSDGGMTAHGLERVIVEVYYVTNATDSAESDDPLPVGSVTYRFYADMLPGYRYQAMFGIPDHELLFTTTTWFFNNGDRGAITPTYTKTHAAQNAVMLDSWLSVGAACANQWGILKEEDGTAGGTTVVNSNVPQLLQNEDPLAGIPLHMQDGLYAGTTPMVTTVGLPYGALMVFDNLSGIGNMFTTTNGSIAVLEGTTGPIPETNRVLIAQLTTDGELHYELNIQIGTPSGGVEQYVARDPVGAEIFIPSMIGTLTPP